ncbi:MAG: YdaU family protein [Rhodospirillales bacterium]|nr:YdaU family protein [Rhodospirillales bacterium]
MSFAFMPVYTGDYKRDTCHLSMMEHGAYMGLLMHCWDQKGPIPLDERRIFAICNARSNEEMGAARNVLSEFFIKMEDGWYNKRMSEEIAKAESISSNNRAAGLASAIARRSKIREMSSERALIARVATDERAVVPPPPPSQLPPHPQPKSRGTRFDSESPTESWVQFCRQERPELNPAETFQRFRDFWISQPGAKGVKLDWFATWRNWVRNERARPAVNGRLSSKGAQAAANIASWLNKSELQ